jgi:hypothetical protein
VVMNRVKGTEADSLKTEAVNAGWDDAIAE